MIIFVVNVIFALLWAAVSGSFTLLNLAFGFVLSAIALYLLREQTGGNGYIWRVRRIVSLFLLFMKELALSAWKVAIMVLTPNMNLKPGIFAFPLTVDRDIEITLLANMITLTPGTFSMDVSDDGRFLYVHAIDCSDKEGAIRDIQDGFERKILEAFR